MYYTRLLSLCIAGIVYQYLGTPALAKTIVFQDSFNTGLDNWQQVRPQGTAWQIKDAAAYVKINQPFQLSELVPRIDLWNASWHNLRFELDYTAIQGTDRNLSFHFQDLQNWYEFHFTTNTITVLHLDNGRVVWSTSKPFTLRNNQTYHIELRLHEADISLFIDEQLVAQEHDPTFSADYGRIGLKAGTGADAPTEIKIDNVVVSMYNPTDLGLLPIKQTDARWASQEYDSATLWAENTGIDSWGCALTSLVMIFKYYGISYLPNNTPLTPENFNTWLQAQPDGYIGEGLVNWQAGLRVARHSHLQFGTPLLAYKKITDGWQDALQAELLALRPAIIQLPGHFLVADGIASTSPLDFAIVDPAFEHTKLTQHTEQPVSIRTFTPTTQILPNITVLSKPAVTAEISDANSTDNQTIDQLKTEFAANRPMRVTELLLSESTSFIVKLASQTFQPANTTLFGYTTTQELIATTILNQIIGPNGTRFELLFDQSSDTVSATPNTTFIELSADVTPLHEQKLLSLKSALLLSEVFSTAQGTSPESSRYVQLGTHVSQTELGVAKDYLLQQLSMIN